MNLQELIALYRAQTLDADEQVPFCDDKLLALYANEAQVEACRRAKLLVDSSGAMCSLAIDAEAEIVPLHAKVIHVHRAYVDRHPVELIHVDQMDALQPGWQLDPPGSQVQLLVTGMTTGALYLWPRPLNACVLKMTVQRLPLAKLEEDEDEPEIREEAHPALVEWMLYRAYGRDDTDLFNDSKAALALSRFEAEFGRKASARNEEWARQGNTVMPGPIA